MKKLLFCVLFLFLLVGFQVFSLLDAKAGVAVINNSIGISVPAYNAAVINNNKSIKNKN